MVFEHGFNWTNKPSLCAPLRDFDEILWYQMTVTSRAKVPVHTQYGIIVPYMLRDMWLFDISSVVCSYASL